MSDDDRLDAVRRVRKIREDQARAKKAEADREVDQADDARTERERELDAVSDLPSHAMPPALLLALKLQGLASSELLQLAEEEYERALDRSRDAQKRLQEAAVARRSIERLAQRREAEAVALRRAASERALDALVVTSHGSKDRR